MSKKVNKVILDP